MELDEIQLRFWVNEARRNQAKLQLRFMKACASPYANENVVKEMVEEVAMEIGGRESEMMMKEQKERKKRQERLETLKAAREFLGGK